MPGIRELSFLEPVAADRRQTEGGGGNVPGVYPGERDDLGRRYVTVDTGGASDAFVGACLTWLHVPRGGYGYIYPVDAVVVAHSRRPRTRVTIEVALRSGAKVKRVVDAGNLRWRATP